MTRYVFLFITMFICSISAQVPYATIDRQVNSGSFDSVIAFPEGTFDMSEDTFEICFEVKGTATSWIEIARLLVEDGEGEDYPHILASYKVTAGVHGITPGNHEALAPTATGATVGDDWSFVTIECFRAGRTHQRKYLYTETTGWETTYEMSGSDLRIDPNTIQGIKFFAYQPSGVSIRKFKLFMEALTPSQREALANPTKVKPAAAYKVYQRKEEATSIMCNLLGRSSQVTRSMNPMIANGAVRILNRR